MLHVELSGASRNAGRSWTASAPAWPASPPTTWWGSREPGRACRSSCSARRSPSPRSKTCSAVRRERCSPATWRSRSTSTPRRTSSWSSTSLRAGRRMRGLYPADVVDDPERLTYVRRWAESGEEVRLVEPPLPTIAVFGTEVALVSATGNADGTGDARLLVRAPALVSPGRATCSGSSGRARNSATVVTARRSATMTGCEFSSVLLVGTKDESIARQLGRLAAHGAAQGRRPDGRARGPHQVPGRDGGAEAGGLLVSARRGGGLTGG